MNDQQAPSEPRSGEAPVSPPMLSSVELLRGAREVIIVHAGENYRLRLTSRDRLILTK
ncbi:MAG TPA: hemin uptake protein HemP [Falsiroseomonas sp.]|jgi:hemin uptake protein HemP|nr:hemin uptake protein HemP [Falsiroseomonas sp.]